MICELHYKENTAVSNEQVLKFFIETAEEGEVGKG